MASVLSPREGMAHECRTSSDEINIRIGSSMGRITRLSTSSSNSFPGFKLAVGTMYESKQKSS